MLVEVFVLFFAIATGFTAAGLVSSFHTLVTNKPASFELPMESLLERLAHLPLIVIGGPQILLRNALRGRILEDRPVGWLFLTLGIVGFWCFVSGLFVLHVFVSV